MRFLYKNNEKILIALEDLSLEYEIEYITKNDNIYIYLVTEKVELDKIIRRNDAFCYLDYFIVLLPLEYNLQQKMWKDFYHFFADDYEFLIDKNHNIQCIEALLQYIYINKLIIPSSNILDYGCGNGLSMQSTNKGSIWGYEPVAEMRAQAKKNGMQVICEENIDSIQNEFFDAVFSSYVMHMGITQSDIVRIIPKLKKGAIWVANYYKGINEEYVNDMFRELGLQVKKIQLKSEGYGNVYEYYRK